jgi:hypothetical protein
MYSGLSGNVGIGTSSPAVELDVAGTIRANSVLVVSSSSSGVWGWSASGNGVSGESLSATGVYGQSTAGYAGWFEGKVHVNGNLTKGSGSFKIDHPLDPNNKYLQHSFVESPDMMNIYNGNVTLDRKGRATVTLPEWFGALNKDFRYQLTALGAPGPNLHVAQEIKDNRFRIAGGKSGMRVSWQVTGVRQDPYAAANRIVVEEDKPANERGYYLHPEAYGLSKDRGIENAPRHQASERQVARR